MGLYLFDNELSFVVFGWGITITFSFDFVNFSEAALSKDTHNFVVFPIRAWNHV
jgi:type IV secretory pathway component VirB8